MRSATTKGTILVVDDEPSNVKLVSTRLRALGYGVVEASDGVEALLVLRSRSVDLVLADVMMPNMDGYELTRRVRDDPQIAGVPILLITALDGTDDRVRGLTAGADDFLTKPVNPVELELRVRSHMRVARLSTELRNRSEILDAALSGDSSAGVGAVLIVDDDPNWVSLLSPRLSAAGYAIETAVDLESARVRLRRGRPDIVLLELQLPDGCGTELVRRWTASKESGAFRAPLVIVITRVDDIAQKLNCLRLGVDDFLIKPTDPDEVLARMALISRRAAESRQLHQQIAGAQSAAYRDPLTGIYNRRFLEEDLARRTARSLPAGFAVGFLDLDRFKQINDTWGHDTGDCVLRAVADCLYRGIRESDLLCRYGGEELVLVLPATPEQDAVNSLKRLNAAVAGIDCPPLSPGAITFSAGVAVWTTGESPGQVIGRADRACYAAKAAGRNCVLAAEE